MGNRPGTCKSTFHAWGVSKGRTGWVPRASMSFWPSIMCFDNCRLIQTQHRAPSRQRHCLIIHQPTRRTQQMRAAGVARPDRSHMLCLGDRDPSWLHTAVSQLTMLLPTLWPCSGATTHQPLKMQPVWCGDTCFNSSSRRQRLT